VTQSGCVAWEQRASAPYLTNADGQVDFLAEVLGEICVHADVWRATPHNYTLLSNITMGVPRERKRRSRLRVSQQRHKCDGASDCVCLDTGSCGVHNWCYTNSCSLKVEVSIRLGRESASLHRQCQWHRSDFLHNIIKIELGALSARQAKPSTAVSVKPLPVRSSETANVCEPVEHGWPWTLRFAPA